jgi:hypothetical protein
MGSEGAVNIIDKSEIAAAGSGRGCASGGARGRYQEKFASPWVAAERGYVDAVIEPPRRAARSSAASGSSRTSGIRTRRGSTETFRSDGGPPFAKLLVANRGEIAVRVIRACHEMGSARSPCTPRRIADALHVRYAHEAYPIGPPPRARATSASTVSSTRAKRSGAEAIHPGYGFSPENHAFARACADAGVTFVGPPVSAMEAMGDKVRSRELMTRAGVAVVPGSPPLRDAKEAAEHAKRIGYPVLLKASAGGADGACARSRAASEMPFALPRRRRGERTRVARSRARRS